MTSHKSFSRNVRFIKLDSRLNNSAIKLTTFHAMAICQWLWRLRVATDRTGCVTPFDEAARVKSMVAQYRQNSIDTFVHSFKTDGTRWQLCVPAQRHSIVPYFDSGYKYHVTNHVWFQRIIGSTIESFIELARCTLENAIKVYL